MAPGWAPEHLLRITRINIPNGWLQTTRENKLISSQMAHTKGGLSMHQSPAGANPAPWGKPSKNCLSIVVMANLRSWLGYGSIPPTDMPTSRFNNNRRAQMTHTRDTPKHLTQSVRKTVPWAPQDSYYIRPCCQETRRHRRYI